MNIARVYLLCDPTTPEDADFARVLQKQIGDTEGIRVDLPAGPADFNSPAADHERLLGESDGVLLYRGKAPDRWYSRNFADLLTADFRARTRELKSRALFVNGIQVAMPGLTVIQREDPFDLHQLEPFLAPLRAQAGGASRAGD